MPAEGRENPLLKKGNFDAFFREKYLTKNSLSTELEFKLSVVATVVVDIFVRCTAERT